MKFSTSLAHFVGTASVMAFAFSTIAHAAPTKTARVVVMKCDSIDGSVANMSFIKSLKLELGTLDRKSQEVSGNGIQLKLEATTFVTPMAPREARVQATATLLSESGENLTVVKANAPMVEGLYLSESGECLLPEHVGGYVVKISIQ